METRAKPERIALGFGDAAPFLKMACRRMNRTPCALTAELLGVKPSTLFSRVKAMGIELPR